MEMTGVKVGDEVRIFDVNGSRQNQPEGGWPGSVVKVGRALMTVEYEDRRRHDPQVFRIEDGSWNDKNYGHQRWVLTAERALENQRRNKAVDTLRRCGLMLRDGHGALYSTEDLEVIARVAVFRLEKTS